MTLSRIVAEIPSHPDSVFLTHPGPHMPCPAPCSPGMPSQQYNPNCGPYGAAEYTNVFTAIPLWVQVRFFSSRFCRHFRLLRWTLMLLLDPTPAVYRLATLAQSSPEVIRMLDGHQ